MEKNKALLDIISPVGVKVKKDTLILGENHTQLLGIISYPQTTDHGWLSKISNIPSTLSSITFSPIDSSEFAEHLNKNISMYKAEERDATNELDRMKANKIVESGVTMLEKIEMQGEKVGVVSTLIMSVGKDMEETESVTRRQKNAVSIIKAKSRVLSFLQKEAFYHLSPAGTKSKPISEMLDKVMPLSSMVYGFPFSNNSYTDDKGYYMGMDSSGGLIVLDMWKREDDRTNSNMVILGLSGIGKSTAVKHIIINEIMMGNRVLVIDPEREYKDLCRKLNGDWINASGGRGKINPLQIRTIPRDEGKDEDEDEDKDEDEDEDKDDYEYENEDDRISELALYLKTLEVFFKLYLGGLTSERLAIIKKSLIGLYKSFGIDFKTDLSSFSNEMYPTMEDYYEFIKKEAVKKKEERDRIYSEYQSLEILLEDIAKGGDSFLWNGYTSLQSDSRLVVIDTKDLQDSSDRVKSTEYYLLSTWLWSEMSKNRNEKVVGLFDEAYLLIDKQVPQALNFLRNASKRCRKYEASMIIISHSVVDFLDESIKMHAQSLLDLPTYKIIFGCDGENLRQTKDLYSLNSQEQAMLLDRKRGRALFFLGSKRMEINFNVPEYEKYYIGSAGGR